MEARYWYEKTITFYSILNVIRQQAMKLYACFMFDQQKTCNLKYFEFEDKNHSCFSPGFNKFLSNQPYYLLRQKK